MYPTEVKVEKFYPPYLDFDQSTTRRPHIMEVTVVPKVARYREKFNLQFTTLSAQIQCDSNFI